MYKPYLLLALAITAFVACKKEERSSEEWALLADAKKKEIEALIATIPCSRQSEATVDGIQYYCGTTYYPVIPSIQSTFDRLRRQYEKLYSNYIDALYGEGVVIDCFDRDPQPIRIDCEDDKLLVYTVRNLPIDEARDMAAELYTKIQHYQDTVSCQNGQGWHYYPVLHAQTAEWMVLPLLQGAGSLEWYDVFSDYQVLSYRIREADGNQAYLPLDNHPKSVTCENGKPVIQYE